jgi:hypothetical protein
MTNRKVNLAPAWRTAARTVARLREYGDVITRAWLEKALRVPYPRVGSRDDFDAADLKFLAAMDAFRAELLRTHKMALRSLGRGEYEIVPEAEQIAYGVGHAARRVANALRRALAVVENTRGRPSARGATARSLTKFRATAGYTLGLIEREALGLDGRPRGRGPRV